MAMKPDDQGIFPFVIVGGGGSASGVFVYDPQIALGDLIASMTDSTSAPTGDVTLPGITDYSAAGLFVNLVNGTVLLGSLAAASRTAIPASLILGDALTDAQRPSLAASGPQATGANKVQIILFGESKDLSAVAQMLVTAGATTPATTALLEVQGTGQFSGILTPGAGTNGSGSAPQLAPGLVVNTPSQLSDTTRDYMVYLTVGTAGTGVQVRIGPNNPPVRNVYGTATPTAGQQIVFRLPAGFWAEVIGTGTTLAAQNAIGC